MTSHQQLFTMFLTEREAEGRSPHTLKKYRLHIGYFLDWCDQSSPPKPLTRTTFAAYLAHLRAIKSANTAANYFAEVVNWCNWLVDVGELETNPAMRLKPKRTIRRMPSYTKGDIRRLLIGANLRDRAIILVLLDTGLRAGEMTQLTTSGIDWTSGHFTVIGKGNKQRSSWIGFYALRAVQDYLKARGYPQEDTLWLNWRGQPLGESGLYTTIKRRALATGIRGNVRRLIHSFRATFAKNYLKNGGDTVTLAGLLGHATLDMTRRYAELHDEDLREKKEAINPLAAYIDEAA